MITKFFHAYYWECKIRNFRWWLQRSKRGWAEYDAWNIDVWFMETMESMLTYYRRHHVGYPPDLSAERWDEIIDRMIFLLKEMQKDDFEAGSIDGIMSSYDKRNNCKDEFFELFSKYFYSLWD